MSDSDGTPPYGALPRVAVSLETETAFLHDWDNDIKRAARAADNGNYADHEDLAQAVRTRLLIVFRAFPEAPPAYVRAVIANSVRSALRRKARTLGAQSPLAEQLDEHFHVCNDDRVTARVTSVAVWVSKLPLRLQAIYCHLYSEGRSQRDAAKLMRVSQPRIAQLHRQLLERARVELAALAA